MFNKRPIILKCIELFTSYTIYLIERWIYLTKRKFYGDRNGEDWEHEFKYFNNLDSELNKTNQQLV